MSRSPPDTPPVDANALVEAGLGPDMAAGADRDAAAPDFGAVPDGGTDLGVADEGAADAAPPADAAPDAMADRWVDGVSLGTHALDTPITFALPESADALLIQARGRAMGLYQVVDVVGPPGRLVDDTGRGPNRTTLNPEVATALLPNDGDPTWALRPGAYRFTVVGAEPVDEQVEVEVWFTRGIGALRVNLWLPPDADRAPDAPAVVTMAAGLAERIEADFGLTGAEVVPALLEPGAPTTLEIDGLRRDFAGLSALAAHRPASVVDGLDVYLVESIEDGASRINGFSGGLPAPFGWPDTAGAVTAVRTNLLDDFPDAVAEVAAHELGHALGLFHTTEARGGTHDPIADTAQCPEACDRDGDGVLLASECGARGMGAPPCQGASDNRMFWTLGGARAMTDGQRRVVTGHPVSVP